jgi:predicted DNA-binding transcriptional regulator YafY
MARKHLVADRFRRIWRIIEEIAQEPGKSRRDLAQTYGLSERQLQSDLNLIRTDIGLPLVRRQGYRFEIEQRALPPALTLREAQLLLLALRMLGRDRAVLQNELLALLRKLPGLFPPHLRPLADRALGSSGRNANPRGQRDDIFTTLSEATVRKAQVRLHYPPGDDSSSIQEPIVRAELLLPYSKSWYLIGQCAQRKRVMMFDLESVTAVTPLFRV